MLRPSRRLELQPDQRPLRVRQITDDFRIGPGNLRIKVGIATIWSSRDSRGVTSKSTISMW
jgi:hypothetical protein